MRLTRNQIILMLGMQDEMNSVINPRWHEAGYPFLRAVVVEGVEAMEHIGWKWWKHQETDLDQARMEIVDIWHFVLSAVLVNNMGNHKAAADWLERRLAALDGPDRRKCWVFDREIRIDGAGLIEKLELLVGLSVFRQISIPLIDALLEDLEMTWSDLFVQYVAKNTLNAFRQANGYKTGQYRKHWHDGREDNEHLCEILRDAAVDSQDLRERIYAELGKRYGGGA